MPPEEFATRNTSKRKNADILVSLLGHWNWLPTNVLQKTWYGTSLCIKRPRVV